MSEAWEQVSSPNQVSFWGGLKALVQVSSWLMYWVTFAALTLLEGGNPSQPDCVLGVHRKVLPLLMRSVSLGV